MKKFKKKISRLLLITLFFSIIQAQSVKEVKAEGGLSVTNATAQELVDKLLGFGITAANIKFTGADAARGTFSGGNGIIGFDEGAILSSGNASYVVGPNDITNKTAENGLSGDADLTSLAEVPTYDAAILEFDFVPTSNVVSFQYVFSSEEYNEWANGTVNDTFAFFINGVNYALIPETETAVSINTVNGGNPLGIDPKNSQYYINNEDKHLNTQMDGLSVVFSVNAPVNQGVTNHIKMSIADGGDSSYDSNVFIKANSINGKIAQPGILDITSKDNYDVTISRSDGSDGTVSVTWQALDGSNSIVKTGVVTFGDGETTKIINVPASTVKVKLINPTGGGTIGDASKEIIFADIPSGNTRPATPGVFTAPVLGQTFKGGDGITVTWGASTDLENDPISYTLEFNNGSSWAQVYNGPSVSYSFTNTSGLNTTNAQFRVKASDDGGYSDYVTSNIFTVDSQAPQIPILSASIVAPTNGDVTVTAAYPEDASAKQYRVGISGAWLNYEAPIIVTTNNTVYARCQDTAGNWSDEGNLDISNIDKTSPNIAVISNADKYTDSIWYNSYQTITASFTNTEGCDEKLQYKLDDSEWTDGESLDVSEVGKHIVSFRVIDALERTSGEQTINVNVDKSAPTNAKITVKDKEFTSFLNDITFGLFFKETVGVTITADCGISGVNKIEYQKVSDAAAYDPNGTWTIGNSFSVLPDEKFIVYAKITDNAGNFVIINSDGVIVDATLPALELTPDADDWTKNNVSVKVKVSDNLSGVKEVSYTTDEAKPQTGTTVIIGGEGIITLTNEGQYKLTVTAKDNSLNEISESINIRIDRTLPIITGAIDSSSYFVGRVIKLTDNLGEIFGAACKNGTDAETSFMDGASFEKPGTYTLTLTDKAGNLSTLSFEIKSLPKLTDVVYTNDCKALI
ncbi:MAG: choice-of-anchor L domain-containing protein, partial [Clostridiaceae bacterium]